MSERRAPDRLRVSGPLAEFADGYRVDLIERGYSLGSAQTHLRLLADVSLWMERERLEPASLTAGVLERYCVSRRRAGHSTYLSPRSLGRLLGYLDGLGVLPVAETVLSPVERLLEEFRRYLLVERGMGVYGFAHLTFQARGLLSALAFKGPVLLHYLQLLQTLKPGAYCPKVRQCATEPPLRDIMHSAFLRGCLHRLLCLALRTDKDHIPAG